MNLKLKDKTKKIIGIIFRSISILFILGCCVFYGSRLIKYFKIYNPKTVKIEGLLSIEVPKKSTIVTSGNGMYHLSGFYVYKGNVDNNYVMFSNMLFRIVKMKYSGNTELILDEKATELYWHENNIEFDKSNIYEYLNTEFIKKLNTEILVKQTICLDEFTSISNTECKNSVEDYVSLPDINTFLTIKNETNYISEENELVWLSNHNSEKVWHTNGNNISTSDANNFYEVKPMIMLDYSVNLLGGTGTITDPYIIEQNEENKDYSGNYVKLGDDLWNIIDIKDDKVKLVLNDVLDKSHVFSKDSLIFNPTEINSLANYLNNEYYNSLTYKDLIIDNVWYTGSYVGNYKTVMETSVTCKVGLPNIFDRLPIDNENQYYLMTSNSEDMYTYMDRVVTAKKTLSKKVKPSIVINKNNLKEGNGSINNPFTVGN